MAFVEQLPRTLAGGREEPSRICGVTGLKVYAGAQALVLANAVAAVLALAMGGIFGTLVGMTRAPAVEALQPNAFYVSLTGHGVAALILWPIFFEVAAIVFASSILLNARVFSLKLGWGSFFLMVAGGMMLVVSIVTDVKNAVMFTAYPPLVATCLLDGQRRRRPHRAHERRMERLRLVGANAHEAAVGQSQLDG